MPLHIDHDSNRYQNLVNVDRPLKTFLLSSLVFSLTSVAFAVNAGKVEESLATALISEFVAVLAGLRCDVTPLQSLYLVLPLSHVSVFTFIIIFKGTSAKSNQMSLQH